MTNVQVCQEKKIARAREHLDSLVEDYLRIGQQHGFSHDDLQRRLNLLWTLAQEQIASPHAFEPWHEATRAPFDYRAFGIEFFRPLVDPQRTLLKGPWNQVREQLQRGENVIFLSNHQSEAEPPAMHLLLEKFDQKLAEHFVMMAGARVTGDPISSPFSLGCNLLCVYSKRHLPEDPLQRAAQLEHNQRALQILREKLDQGGIGLWVACAGGRDRPDASGAMQIAPFDPESVELLRLLGMRSSVRTHWYPLALCTYRLLAPPQQRQSELGEHRVTLGGGIGMELLPEVEWTALPEGKENREQRALLLEQQVATAATRLQQQIEEPTHE